MSIMIDIFRYSLTIQLEVLNFQLHKVYKMKKNEYQIFMSNRVIDNIRVLRSELFHFVKLYHQSNECKKILYRFEPIYD